MGSNENVTLDAVYSELLYLHKKIDKLEEILIPEVEMTKEEREELETAKTDYKEGKTVEFKTIKKG